MSKAPEPQPTASATVSAVDVVGNDLGDAWAALAASGFTVTATDVREGRSIWLRSNWVVVSQEVNGASAVLGVEKFDDPACWTGAVGCVWTPVFEFDATDDATSDHFVLDGGPARLTYVVTAESTTDGIRTADIYFQDLAAHTESSYVDTTIYVDKPGSGIADLGLREGTFFIMTGVRPLNVAGVTIHISVEQMRPVSD